MDFVFRFFKHFSYFRNNFAKAKLGISKKFCLQYGAQLNFKQHPAFRFFFWNVEFLLVSWQLGKWAFSPSSVVQRRFMHYGGSLNKSKDDTFLAFYFVTITKIIALLQFFQNRITFVPLSSPFKILEILEKWYFQGQRGIFRFYFKNHPIA